MRNSKVQFLLGFGAAIAILVIGVYGGLLPGLSGKTYSGPTLISEAFSGDGQYVARRERKSNNNDWCEDRTTIDRVGNRSSWEREYVFMNECEMPVEMQWVDNRSLRISYGFNPRGKAHVYREAFSKDKQIKIDYRLKEEAPR